MKKSTGFSILKIIFYLLGFPILAGYAVYKTIPTFTLNSTYKPYVFAGMLVLFVIALLYFGMMILTGVISKKAKSVGTVRRTVAASVLISVLLTTGIWIALDKVVPPILGEATQYTLSYDDFKDDYDEKARIHSELLTHFIEMNLKNGRLSADKAEQYFTEGYANEEVKKLIEASFNSLNNDGFGSFGGMLISLADGSRLTIPVLIHLLFDERDAPSTPFPDYVGEGRGEENADAPIRWSILDIQEGAMTFSVDLGALGAGSYAELIKWLIPSLFGEGGMVEALLDGVESAIADESIIGSPIYIGIDYEGNTITVALTPSSESRGVYDYKNMAYLANNRLLIAVTSLFPIRTACYTLGFVLTLSTLVIGMLRKKEYERKEGGRS
ncbi:MAG: hypothetical protein LBT20_07905 [Clostridiales bacterium]|jgi:hypothetical protein|nr:hypothetical protein [Clostridiales bacterium]